MEKRILSAINQKLSDKDKFTDEEINDNNLSVVNEKDVGEMIKGDFIAEIRDGFLKVTKSEDIHFHNAAYICNG